jgi:uncharacterized protein YjiK
MRERKEKNNMLFILSKHLFFLSLVFTGCAGEHTNEAASEVKEKPYETGYHLEKPDQRFILPDTLHEISGLTNIDANTFACVQDENGIVFIYDVLNNKIKKQFTFNIDGDYEGITRVGKTIYILRSDGVLFEISNYESENFKLTSYETGIPANNNEGLCYDADHNRLLIACKSKIGKGKEYKDKRAIYAFDLGAKTLSDEPAFEFDVQAISAFAAEKDIEIASKEKKKGRPKAPAVKFRTSAIGIHPVTKKLYLLSASDHMLFIFDMEGSLEHIEQLDEEMFNKAEGITFYENGDMLITNEGQDKKPTLLRFTYQEK